MLVDDGVPIAYKPQDVVLKDATYVCIRRRDNWFIKISMIKSIELAAVKVHNGEIIDKFERFSNPHERLSETIINLTHITDDVSRCPEVEEVLTEFQRMGWRCDIRST